MLLAIRIRGPTRTAYAALFAVALAWAISAGVDWEWEMPSATLWLFIAAGLALASAETDPAINQSEPRKRTAMAVGCLVLAAAPLLIGVSYQRGCGSAGRRSRRELRQGAQERVLLDFAAVRPS